MPVRADRSPEIKPLQESEESEGDHTWHVDDDKAEVLGTREQLRCVSAGVHTPRFLKRAV